MSGTADDIAIRIARAEALRDLGRHHEAITLLRHVLADDPDQVRAWCVLALSQVDADENAEALRSARRACTLAPADEWAQRIRSLAASKLGKHEEAVRAARRAIAARPDIWYGHAQLASALAGGINGDDPRKDQPNWKEADAAVERALELGPDQAEPHFVAGKVAQSQGRLWTAEQFFRRALTINPGHSRARNELARLPLLGSGGGDITSLARAVEGFAGAAHADPRYELARRNFFLVLRVLAGSFATGVLLAVFIHWLMRAATVHRPVAVLQWLSLVVLVLPQAQFRELLPVWSPSTRRAVIRELTCGTQGLAAAFLVMAQLLAFTTPWLPGSLPDEVDALAASLALLAREILYAEPLATAPSGQRAGLTLRWTQTWRRAASEVAAGLTNARHLPRSAVRLAWALRLLLLGSVAVTLVPWELGWQLAFWAAVLLGFGILRGIRVRRLRPRRRRRH